MQGLTSPAPVVSGPTLSCQLKINAWPCVRYLNKGGYCYNGDCQVFPVIYGEFGSELLDPRDVQARPPSLDTCLCALLRLCRCLV